MKRHLILSLLLISSLLLPEQKVFAAKAKKEKSKSAAEKKTDKNSFELYPEDFSAILKDALKNCDSGNFDDAVSCFDDRIYSYRKEEVSEKNLTRLELISADVQKQVREYKKIRMEKTAAKLDFSNPSSISSAENYFTKLAATANKLRDLGQQIQSVAPSGYPYYLSRFVLGINEEPDSGLAGTIEVEFNKEIEQLMNSVWEQSKASCKIIETGLSENNIFTNSETLEKAHKEFEKIPSYTEELKKAYSYNSKLKGKHLKNQKQNADFNTSMKSVTTLFNEGEKFFNGLNSLQTELKKTHSLPQDKIASIRSDNDSYAEELVASASSLMAIGLNY